MVLDASKCHSLFAQFDEDDSGFLDREEVKMLLHHLGLKSQLEQNPLILDKMIADIESARARKAAEAQAEARAGAGTEVEAEPESDGQVELDELLPWFLQTGRSYLPKPVYPVVENLEDKSDEELMMLFFEIDE